MAFVIDRAEIYKEICGRGGRQADNLKETAARVFKDNSGGAGTASFQGDRYSMQFDGIGESEGFHRAALVISDIGTRILGILFETMEVPDFIIAAKVEDITDADGTVNHHKVDDVVEDGVVPTSMDKPTPADPIWLQQSWKKNTEVLKIAKTEKTRSPFDYDDEDLERRSVNRKPD
jgi:hypothetical protein